MSRAAIAALPFWLRGGEVEKRLIKSLFASASPSAPPAPGCKTLKIRATGVDEHGAAETLGLHLLEVTGDRSFGDIAVKPPPIGLQPGLGGRVVPALVEGGGGGSAQPGQPRTDKLQIIDIQRPAG